MALLQASALALPSASVVTPSLQGVQAGWMFNSVVKVPLGHCNSTTAQQQQIVPGACAGRLPSHQSRIQIATTVEASIP